MTRCLFVSDLHGQIDRYQKLFHVMAEEKPEGVFIGGDFLPAGSSRGHAVVQDFVAGYLPDELTRLRTSLAGDFPRIFLIMGNDDERAAEPAVQELERRGLLEYIHDRKRNLEQFVAYGYAYVPPTPFLLKDWERYDVSRYIDPGDISPEEGWRSVPVPERERKHSTIKSDLDRLTGDEALDQAVFLFHAPPYQTNLDRAALDGSMIDGVPMDIHVGSIAVRRFIEARQPLLTLHGHIHESAALTGSWRDTIGRTHLFSAAHDGSELAVVSFELENVESATRRLL
ncbi:MAG: metallophosphoesterase [candidate division Zixibacteria bacterium]|nr:metallophosphoesterase [candidate division Zixibacteria bacterium]